MIRTTDAVIIMYLNSMCIPLVFSFYFIQILKNNFLKLSISYAFKYL